MRTSFKTILLGGLMSISTGACRSLQLPTCPKMPSLPARPLLPTMTVSPEGAMTLAKPDVEQLGEYIKALEAGYHGGL